jgi:hypothetical protein
MNDFINRQRFLTNAITDFKEGLLIAEQMSNDNFLPPTIQTRDICRKTLTESWHHQVAFRLIRNEQDYLSLYAVRLLEIER